MADAMEDAYARGFEAGKAMKEKEVKDEESLDLDQSSELKLAFDILGLIGGSLLLLFFCGYLVKSPYAFCELLGLLLSLVAIALLGAVVTKAGWAVRTVIKYQASCISRKRKKPDDPK